MSLRPLPTAGGQAPTALPPSPVPAPDGRAESSSRAEASPALAAATEPLLRAPAHPHPRTPGQPGPTPPHAFGAAPRLASRQVRAEPLAPGPRGRLTLLRTPQRSTGGPDSVSGSSSEPDEFQLWLSDMEARQPSGRPAPAPRAAPEEAPRSRGEGPGGGEGRSARSGAGGGRRGHEVRPPRRRCRA